MHPPQTLPSGVLVLIEAVMVPLKSDGPRGDVITCFSVVFLYHISNHFLYHVLQQFPCHFNFTFKNHQRTCVTVCCEIVKLVSLSLSHKHICAYIKVPRIKLGNNKTLQNILNTVGPIKEILLDTVSPNLKVL